MYRKTLVHPETDYDRTTGVSFREYLGGYAACGLLRKNFPSHPISPDQNEYREVIT